MKKSDSTRQILVVESGASKTDWRVVGSEGVLMVADSAGINPLMQGVEGITDSQQDILIRLSGMSYDEIQFYGAGCATEQARLVIEQVLSSHLKADNVLVESDLVAAGKALFGEGEGIACILGTGSNSCYFAAGKVMKNVPSLGYLLGDEGGGSQIGKRVMIDYLRQNLPEAIAKDLDEHLKMDRAAIYHRLYAEPYPNRFLAGLVSFLTPKYSGHDYFYGQVFAEFSRFFANCLCVYPVDEKTRVGFVGSIAYYFQKALLDVAGMYEFEITHILKKPIDQLVEVIKQKIQAE